MGKYSLFLSYLFTAGLAQSLLLFFLLLFIKRNHRANLFLAIYILVITVPFFLIFLSMAGIIGKSHVTFSIIVGLTSVSGVFIYWYVCAISGQKRNLAPRSFLHLSFFPLFSCASMLFLSRRSGRVDESALFHFMVTLFLFVGIAIPVAYIIKSFVLIRRYYKMAESWYSGVDKVSMEWLKKITVLSLVFFATWAASFLFGSFLTDKGKEACAFFHFVIVILIIFITAYHVVRQDEFFRDGDEMNDLSETSESSFQKYAKQRIDEDDLKRYSGVLMKYMEDHKPYLDEDITIRNLAERMDMPTHHLSIVINSVFSKNFTTFINEFRINEAKELLLREQGSEVNILAIAYRSGFSSKSSFNMTFKKLTGQTPSQYRQSVA